MPDRFANGDTTNDNVEGMLEKADRSNSLGRHGGDIKGIVDHLDYFTGLGVTALWINPLLENNMPQQSYHGYAITDYYKVDPRFGTNEDYRNLVRMAHAKGLKIIMDMVENHAGTGYYWNDDLPSKDWYNEWPEFTRSNYRGGTQSDPYTSKADHDKMVKGWFDVTMADLNQHNPYLMTYLIQNSIWWIEYVGLDGIRMDTYPYPYEDAMAQWAKRVLEEYPGFSMVGEAWLNYPSQVAVWQADQHICDGYQSYLPYVFDFPLYDALGKAFTENDGWSSGVVRFYDVLSQDYLYTHPENIVVFADNHDGSRIFTKVGEDPERLKMAVTLVMTTRGVPQIYYGTEILMSGDESMGHGRLRKDFPGGWEGDTVNAFSGTGLTFEQRKTMAFMKRLANWRKNKTVIHHGKLKHFLPVDGLYVYFRYDDNDTVMVVLNTAEKPNYFNPERYSEMLKGFRYGKNILTNKMYELTKMKIFPKRSMVLELRR
jgi:glycosidase